MSSITEIAKFGSAWQEKKGFLVDASGTYKFAARIKYVSPRQGTQIETLDVKIIRNGNEDGRISIDEGNTLNAATHHLDFSADYQKYRFDESAKALVVSGTSPKMGGSYTVSLLPSAG